MNIKTFQTRFQLKNVLNNFLLTIAYAVNENDLFKYDHYLTKF